MENWIHVRFWFSKDISVCTQSVVLLKKCTIHTTVLIFSKVVGKERGKNSWLWTFFQKLPCISLRCIGLRRRISHRTLPNYSADEMVRIPGIGCFALYHLTRNFQRNVSQWINTQNLSALIMDHVGIAWKSAFLI